MDINSGHKSRVFLLMLCGHFMKDRGLPLGDPAQPGVPGVRSSERPLGPFTPLLTPALRVRMKLRQSLSLQHLILDTWEASPKGTQGSLMLIPEHVQMLDPGGQHHLCLLAIDFNLSPTKA